MPALILGLKKASRLRKKEGELFHTPEEAVWPLLDAGIIPPGVKVIWECCDPGNSKIADVFRQCGYQVVSTDILTGFDFLCDAPNFSFDMIVTNPPYSLKTAFLQKCYCYGKPFALLLPITALEGFRRGRLFAKHGINLLLLPKRVNFLPGKRGCWFPVAWFFWTPEGENNRIVFAWKSPAQKPPAGGEPG